MENNFFDLLKYTTVKEEKMPKDREKIIHELDIYSDSVEDVYNCVDYEKLCYFELFFKDDEYIQNKIHQLKEKICYFYIQRQKLIERFSLRQEKEDNV